MRICVTGSKQFVDTSHIEHELFRLFGHKIDYIVTGTNSGVEAQVRKFALAYNIPHVFGNIFDCGDLFTEAVIFVFGEINSEINKVSSKMKKINKKVMIVTIDSVKGRGL